MSDKLHYCIKCGKPLRARYDTSRKTFDMLRPKYTFHCYPCGLTWEEDDHIDVIQRMIEEMNILKSKVRDLEDQIG